MHARSTCRRLVTTILTAIMAASASTWERARADEPARGACHGTPTGKGGFRLSLRGYLPDQDFAILSREAGGRRINPIAAGTSLMLRKPLGEVPHEGGLRLSRTSKTYEFLHDWIREGAHD